MRVLHRYLGFFLAGIMAVYALSGIVMIFRNTSFLKSEKQVQKTVEKNLSVKDLGRALRMREVEDVREEGDMIYFENGSYNKSTGEAKVMVKELPFFIEKMTHMHKASFGQPLFFLNIFFGLSLLFFVISAFWMFRPQTQTFKTGLYYTLGGIVLTLVMLLV